MDSPGCPSTWSSPAARTKLETSQQGLWCIILSAKHPLYHTNCWATWDPCAKVPCTVLWLASDLCLWWCRSLVLCVLSPYGTDPCPYSQRSPYHRLQDQVLGELWGEEPVLCLYLFVPHSRHLLSLGCKFVVFLLQAPNLQWSLQQKPSISLHSLTELDGVAFQVLRCFIISLDLILKTWLRPENAVQCYLRCYRALLLSSPFIFLLLLINEQHSSVHWGVVRDEILGMIFKYPGMS